MPVPRSREALSLVKLAEYLELECQVYEPNISWKYYSQVHDSSMPPMGFIETPKGTPVYQNNFDFIGIVNYYNLVLMLSNIDYYESILLLHDWRSLITTNIMRKLKKEGFETYFRGIELVDWNMNPSINQDEGATSILRLLYKHEDCGEHRYSLNP